MLNTSSWDLCHKYRTQKRFCHQPFATHHSTSSPLFLTHSLTHSRTILHLSTGLQVQHGVHESAAAVAGREHLDREF
jgi:hypothetical protein